MPRLQGYRERISANYYDALFCAPAGSLQDKQVSSLIGHYVRLFGPGNIGNPSLTNTQQGHCFPGDRTVVVTNWYARTTMPDTPAFRQFTNSAMATLQVGEKTYGTMPLSELLERREGDLMGRRRIPELDAVGRQDTERFLAESVWEAYTHETREARAQGKTFGDLGDKEKERWIRVARDLCSRLSLLTGRPVIIPVRQNYSVNIDIFDRDALDAAFRELPVIPAELPDFRFGLWVHLEGLETREVQ